MNLEGIGAHLGYSAIWVWELINSGELDVCKKNGRRWWAWVKDLDAWLESRSK